MADLPRAYSQLNVSDIGVVRSSGTQSAGNEWGALTQAANQVGEGFARQDLAQREFDARLEAAGAGVTRDSTGNLVFPTFDTSSVEGRAGAAQALKNYEVQFRLDADARAKQMHAEAALAGNPGQFADNWMAYSEATLGTVPEATRGLAKQVLTNLGTEYGTNLVVGKLEQDNKLAVNALTAANTQIVGDLTTLANIGQGASEKAAGLIARYKDNLGSLVQRRVMNEDQAKLSMEAVQREMGVQAFMGEVRNAWDAGRATGSTPGEIRAQVQGMVDKAVLDPEFKATVEQRGQMRSAATAWLEARTGTENVLTIERERAAAEKITLSLIDIHMRERKALAAGDTAGLATLQGELERLVGESGKQGGQAVTALFALDAQIARLEREGTTQRTAAFDGFLKSVDGNNATRQALAGITSDEKHRPLIETAIADYNKSAGTSLTYDEVVGQVRSGDDLNERVARADRIIGMLKPAMEQARQRLDTVSEVQAHLTHGGLIRQDVMDRYGEMNAQALRSNMPQALHLYTSLNALPSIETRMFQAGRTNNVGDLVRGSQLYESLPEHLKARVPERGFWQFMASNLRGFDVKDEEKHGDIVKMARGYNTQVVSEVPAGTLDAVRASAAPGADGDAGIRRALTSWADGQRGILERMATTFDFTGKLQARQALDKLPQGQLPGEMRTDIANRAARYLTESPIMSREQAMELATTDAIEKGGWSPSVMASPNGGAVWTRNAAEKGFAAAGLTGADTTRYVSRLIDTSDDFHSRTSDYTSFGREMMGTGRVVVRPATGPNVDPSKGYGFEIHVRNDNGLWGPVTDGGNSVFYATRANSLYSTTSQKYARGADEFVKEVEANYQSAFGSPMSNAQRELWGRFSGFVAKGQTDAMAFVRWMGDYRDNASPARAARAWDLGVAHILNKLEGGPGVHTDPETKGRGRMPAEGTQ